jgi:hypothetical protein
MGNKDVARAFAALVELERILVRPAGVPHEESAEHKVFCDEHFCLERGPLGEE